MKELFQITVVLIITLCSLNGYTQEVISSAGEYAKTSGIQLNWTIGEPVIETVTSGENIVTQKEHL